MIPVQHRGVCMPPLLRLCAAGTHLNWIGSQREVTSLANQSFVRGAERRLHIAIRCTLSLFCLPTILDSEIHAFDDTTEEQHEDEET